MGTGLIEPAFADTYFDVNWGADPSTSGGVSPSVVAGNWLGCIMPMDNLYIKSARQTAAAYIFDSVTVAARTGSGGTVASEAKVGIWKTTDSGTTWENVLEVGVTSQWNTAPTGSFSALTLDLTGTAEAARTFELDPNAEYAWGIVATNAAGGGVFMKRHDAVGPLTAKWIRLIANSDDLSSIDSGDFESWTGDIAGYATFRTKEKTWMRLSSPYAGSATKVRVPWSSDAYSIMALKTIVPDSITLTADLMQTIAGAESKQCDFDVVMNSGSDKVTFGVTPSDLAFDTTHGRPDSDRIDYVFNIYPDSSNIAIELGRRNRQLSEGGESSTDPLWRAHMSAVATTHNSNDTLAEYPGWIDFAAAAGASIETLTVGRPLWTIVDSQGSQTSGTGLDTYRLTAGLFNRLEYPQEILLLGSPGAKWAADSSGARTATYKVIQHPTAPETASAISVMKGCDVWFAGLGVNDVSGDVDAPGDPPEFIGLFCELLMQFWKQLTLGDNVHDNRLFICGLPDWIGATSTERGETVQNLSLALSGVATALRVPYYNPFPLSVAIPDIIDSDDIHYKTGSSGADIVMNLMVEALQGDANDTTRANAAPDVGSIAVAVKALLYDDDSQDNRLAVDADGEVTSSGGGGGGTVTAMDPGVITAAAFATDAITSGALAASAVSEIVAGFGSSSNVYQAQISVCKDGANSQDTYAITLYLNGAPITSGVTGATLTVTDADGETLIDGESLTDAGSHRFVYVATGAERITEGLPYFADVGFTHDSGSRATRSLLSRDAA